MECAKEVDHDVYDDDDYYDDYRIRNDGGDEQEKVKLPAELL